MYKYLEIQIKPLPLQPKSTKQGFLKVLKVNGAVVQLVRIQACHAWGRGFESRPHRLMKTKKTRKVLKFNTLGFFIFLLT